MGGSWSTDLCVYIVVYAYLHASICIEFYNRIVGNLHFRSQTQVAIMQNIINLN